MNEDTHIKATHFCKTCEDPEPFCESCAKQHTRQKICKDHEICGDMNDYPQQVAKPWYVNFYFIQQHIFVLLSL